MSVGSDYDQQVALIKDCLVSVVAPQVQLHGGQIEFISYDYESGTVMVTLKGACRGCPISSYTLKMGVLAELQKVVPTVRQVVEDQESV